MYKSNFVVSISVKDGTEFLRELDDTVRLPFNTEYQIYLKNLNDTKALVSVTIDGKDILDGNQIIIAPGTSTTLERFIEDGHLDKGHRLKFIEKTDAVRMHRGDQPEDGIIRVTYQFEKRVPVYNPPIVATPYYGSSYTSTTTSGTWSGVSSASTVNLSTCANVDTDILRTTTVNTSGITGKGSVSDQTFKHGNIGTLDPMTHVITLQLKGTMGNDVVTQPVTTKVKLQCDLCGTMNPSSHKYCRECGNCLIALD